MEDVKNYLKKNICIFCDNNRKENCMNIQQNKNDGVFTCKCLNFIKKQQQSKEERIFSKFIKFEYLNEFNRFTVVIIKETPHNIIDQLKLKYDQIEIQEQ